MSDKWNAFEPAQFFPPAVQSATDALDGAIAAGTASLKLAQKALTIAKALSAKAQTNPVEAALRATLAEIEEFVDGITGNTQCHAILIPIRKKIQRRTPSQLGNFRDLVTNFNDPTYGFIQASRSATAGTPVFWRTLVESVKDVGDTNRPDFPSTYATTGVCVLAAADTLTDLQVPLQLFANLFLGNLRLSPTASVLPVVQDLKVSSGAIQGGTGVSLRWTPLAPVANLPLFTGDTVVAKEIFLVRTSDPLSQGFSNWMDLFIHEPLDSPTDLQEKGNAKVIARIQNHGFVRSYVDTTNVLDPKTTYYYAACVRYTIEGVVQPMGAFSNVVRVSRRAPSRATSRGVPPDWVATPTLLQLIPPLNTVVGRVKLGLSRLGTRTLSNTGNAQLLASTLTQIERLVQTWEQTFSEVQDVTDRLQVITSLGAPGGMYATTITKETGGIDGWLAELAKRLSDETDDSRPQVSDSAVVIGYVIVAGAPRLPELKALRALLELFFGSHPANPLIGIAAAFDGAGNAATPTPTASSPVLGYDAALQPAKSPQC